MIVIKRYSNRKLYNAQTRSYITLEEIGEMIRQGEDVQVIDHASGADLTAVTLLQVIFEQEKRIGGRLPRAMLSQLIQAGGSTLNALRSSVHAFLDPKGYLEAEIRRRLRVLEARQMLPADERTRLEELLLSPDLQPTEETEFAPSPEESASLEDLVALQAKIAELEKEVSALLQQAHQQKVKAKS